MIGPQRLAEAFVHAADSLVHDFDPVEFLDTLTETVRRITLADAVGLMLADQDGRLQYVASSNEDGRALSLLQISLDQGPCLDAFATRSPVVNADLTAGAALWPRFASRAVALSAGYRSVQALPLRLRDDAVGTMGVFGSGNVEFDLEEIAAVQALADVATISILQSRALARADLITGQLQGALDSRVVIEQAKGAIAMVAGVSVSEAFQVLRTYARRRGLRLTDVAAEVLDDPRGTASRWRA